MKSSETRIGVHACAKTHKHEDTRTTQEVLRHDYATTVCERIRCKAMRDAPMSAPLPFQTKLFLRGTRTKANVRIDGRARVVLGASLNMIHNQTMSTETLLDGFKAYHTIHLHEWQNRALPKLSEHVRTETEHLYRRTNKRRKTKYRSYSY
mmetsp:Transcript_27699/g.65049  ORF Transcript_27699/g.65049 Transcript_27699/m.65049 type:complete len:151 (-) Transcript_27699:55-507(-)